jgi:hypothetical protein
MQLRRLQEFIEAPRRAWETLRHCLSDYADLSEFSRPTDGDDAGLTKEMLNREIKVIADFLRVQRELFAVTGLMGSGCQ